MIRKWILTECCLPKEDQKVYYFSKSLGIFRGQYNHMGGHIATPHKFSNKHNILDSSEVQYWMPYDHSYVDILPLPPDYDKEQSLIMDCDEITIPKTKTEYSITSSDIFWK